jgi:hypothetical protein
MPKEVQAQTQGSTQFEKVEISLFPEYNQPSVYAIIDITLIENTSLPRELTIQIPSSIDDFFVSYLGKEGYLELKDVKISQENRWKYINLTSPSSTLRIEYNDKNLLIQGDNRTYDFYWSSLYPTYFFSVGINQPDGVGQFEVNKDVEVTAVNKNGIKLLTLRQSPLPSDRLFEFTLSYIKIGEITYPGLVVQAGDPITENTPGRVPTPWNLAVWLFLIALLILLLVGVYFLWFRKKTSQQRRVLVQGLGIMNPEKMAVFCHECGMRSRPGENYCSNCGTELRKPTSFIRPSR